MLGFHVIVSRIDDPGLLGRDRWRERLLLRGSAEEKGKQIRQSIICGERLAAWVTGCEGLRWIEHLCVDHDVRHGATNCGYPVTYFGNAASIAAAILSGAAGDLEREAEIDVEALVLLRREDWLLVEAWDLS